ncbi:MAG TPA: efflux RND transporter periplasmic adaptor subunit [Desulfomonilia bacterium]|nr:efflux RND transporter periplasmic adaptor subunit [Desulfomonilia bacterium]
MSIRHIFDRVDSGMKRVEIPLRFLVPVLTIILTATLMISGCTKKLPAPPPPVVEVAEVEVKDIPISAELVSTLDGMVNATIRAQVQGYLIKQNYKEGEPVHKNQVLFEIDPRTFQATFNQAKARWDQAKANLARIKPLAAQNAVSQKDLDDAIGNEQSTKANYDKASLELEFTRITSPIDGIAGIAKAQLGNLVGPGQIEELTTVSTVHPIKAYVSISEQQYLKIQEIKLKREKEKETVGKIQLELILADGSLFPHKGEFAFADRQVDERTGTIRVAATFPNPDNMLRPGQFARIRALLGTQKNAMLIPQRAVKEVQGRYLVGLIDADNKVVIKEVEAGQQFGQLWVINKGLQPGDKVIAEGIQKVKEGQVVSQKPFVPPSQATPGEGPEAGAQPGTEQKPEAEPATQANPDKVDSHG